MTTGIFNDQRGVRFDAHWDQRLDELAAGALSEDDFVAELKTLHADSPESPWAVVALMDQRFRRGQLTAETFRAIESRIAQRDPEVLEVELDFDPDSPAPPVITDRSLRSELDEDIERTPRAAEAAPPEPDSMPEMLPVGTVLRERYEIRGRVGEGGLGTVYQAIDRLRHADGVSGGYVAIKVVPGDSEDYAQALARLRREFYCAQSLAHRSVVRVFDIDRDDELDFYTMEHLDGELLSHVLGRFNWQPLPRNAAWGIIHELAEALAHAHERHVVHADLRPHNIMILKSGGVRIMDFGAFSAEHPLQLATPYTSCELLEGNAPDPRDDLFALACLAYELLAGKHPYDYKFANEAQALKLKPAPPPGLSSQQWRVLEQGLAFERENRSVTVRNWLKALGAGPVVLEGIPVPGAPPPAGTPKPRVARARGPSRNVRLASILGAIGLVALLAVLYFRQEPSRQTAALTALVPAAPRSPTPDTAEPLAAPAPLPAPAPAVKPAPAPKVAATSRPPVVPSTPAPSTAPPPPAATRTVTSPPVVAAPVKAPPKPVTPAPVAAQPTPSRTAKATAEPRASRTAAKSAGGTFSLAQQGYWVHANARFIEVKVVRTDASAAASFSWWTEDGTALGGIDYVAQPKTTTFFAAGARVMSLFIKTASNAPRRAPVTFTVQIGAPSSGAVKNARTRVTLLSNGR